MRKMPVKNSIRIVERFQRREFSVLDILFVLRTGFSFRSIRIGDNFIPTMTLCSRLILWRLDSTV